MERYKLKELSVCNLSYGSGAAACEFDGETRYVRITDISDEGKLGDDIVSPSYFEDKHILHDGDILFARTGATVGKTFLYKRDYGKCIYAGFLIRMIPDVKKVIPNYIYHFTKSPRYNDFIAQNMKVVAQPNINAKQYGDLEIDVPELEKQKDIVGKLDKVDELQTLRKQQLAKLDDLVKSRFVELFGDVSDFVNITDIAHTYIGLVTTMTKHYCNNGTPLLFNSSIKSDKIVWDGTYLDMEFAEANKSRMHKTNDIVTVHTGDIGTSAVVGEEFNNSLGFATIVTRINDISRYYPRFVSSFLNYGSGKEQLKKYSRDVRNNLNLKDFNRLMVPNVSALEQKRYVDFLEQTDKSKLEIQQSLEKLETLKKSLMQKYFG